MLLFLFSKLLRINAKLQKKSTSSTDNSKINAEEIIKVPHETPKMVKTVIQVHVRSVHILCQFILNIIMWLHYLRCVRYILDRKFLNKCSSNICFVKKKAKIFECQ